MGAVWTCRAYKNQNKRIYAYCDTYIHTYIHTYIRLLKMMTKCITVYNKIHVRYKVIIAIKRQMTM